MNNFIFFKDTIQLAYRSIMRQKLRTVLTILAISIGIASVITIISAGKGLEGLVMSELDIYNPNSINIEVKIPGKGGSNSMAGGVTITTLKNSDLEEIDKHQNLELSYGYVVGQEVIKYQGESKMVNLFGYGANADKIEKFNFSEGRFYNNHEEDSLAQVLVLGAGVKEKLFGQDYAVDKKVYIRGQAYKIVGVLAKKGASFGFDYDNLVYIPTKTIQKKFLGTDYVMGIMTKVIDMEKIDTTKKDIELLLRERHDITDPDKDDFRVITMDEIQEMVTIIFGGITLLLIALVCVSLLVGGVGITNIMYVSVVERTFEIGLRKAVGAKKNNILWQFLIETVFLTFSGGILGIIFGILLSYIIYCVAVNYGLNWVFSIPFYSIILAIGFSTIVGLFFGIYPAKKAAQLDPIEALRKE
ncbi:MAG TPA: ABC transporter permease [Candidatus Magasanikbacteria bacterium]|jgi:ABC-type antimicrobial peptide transport system permease subunit|nr:ABC transporter permease [Candidatus Magasanikbacteria bacterium]